MQKFEMPELSVEEFEVVDVIMSESLVEEPENTNSENELPDQWD